MTHNLESTAVVFDFKIWRHYLYGVNFDLYMDNNSPQYVFIQKELNLRQRKWLVFLKDYNMSILNHPDKDNMVAASLFRLFMGSVSHVQETKRNLVKYIHRLAFLGVRMKILQILFR